MINVSFTRARHDSLKFFQSPLPYLLPHAVALYTRGSAKRRSLDEPHQHTRRLLTFQTGHYGIYVSLFNHELRRQDRDEVVPETSMLVVLPNLEVVAQWLDLLITRTKQQIRRELQSVSARWLSTTSLVQKCAFPQPVRGYCTRVQDQASEEPADGADSEDFEGLLLKTLLTKIRAASAAAQTPADLDIIYPLYQTLRRNDIPLPAIADYNLVLHSLAARLLDSEPTLSATEGRLSAILTVYKDVLAECPRNPACMPDAATYDTVLGALFAATRQIVETAPVSADSARARAGSLALARQFYHVSINLYLSVQAKHRPTRCLADALVCANAFPDLLTKDAARGFLALASTQVAEPRFYAELVSVARHFGATLELTKKETYDFVNTVFATYKAQGFVCSHTHMYGCLLESLIANGNLPVATRFLDTILLDYKQDLLEKKPVDALGISELVSKYIEATLPDLRLAHDLMSKFKAVPYIPELTAHIYHRMVAAFVAEYIRLEGLKSATNQHEINTQQVDVYNVIWELYNYASIRPDFQQLLADTPSSCREALLSLSIDLGDHPNIARLTKEIILKDTQINDWDIVKKLFVYLHAGATSNASAYYHDLMWTVFEQQARMASDVNAFLSEHVDFLKLPQNATEFFANLIAVRRAFEYFSLDRHNIYGLVSVINHLMEHDFEHRSDQLKVLHYQSLLVCQFEDTDNHYTQIDSELRAFKEKLYENYSTKILDNVSSATPSMQAANSALSLPPLMTTESLQNSTYFISLSAKLAVNYYRGVRDFFRLFKAGYNFDDMTWNMLFNDKFVLENLESEQEITIPAFVGRLCVRPTNKLPVLIALNNDKVNIRVLSTLMNLGQGDIIASCLPAFADYFAVTENQYFRLKFFSSIDDFLPLNKSNDWLAKVLSSMEKEGLYSEVLALNERCDILKAIDTANADDAKVLATVITAMLRTRQYEGVSNLLQKFFSGPDGNKRILQSDKLLSCLIAYYTAIGQHELVTTQFSSVHTRSTHLRRLVEFNSFIASVNGEKSEGLAVQDSHDLALAVLKETTVNGMSRVLEKNKSHIRGKAQLFSIMLEYLKTAATTIPSELADRLSLRLVAIIRLCKTLHVKQISAETFALVLDILTSTKSTGLLHVLFNKFLVNNRLLPSLNFYFLKVNIATRHEAQLLLNKFKESLNQMNDLGNLEALRRFETTTTHS